MKTVSLWQPYASLIAAGVKTIETRGWAPPKGVMGQRGRHSRGEGHGNVGRARQATS